MAEMSIEQQRALALAGARLRLQQQGGGAPPADAAPAKFVPSGEKTSGWVGDVVGFNPRLLGTTEAEAIAGHPFTRFALGAASPFLGGAQLVSEAAGIDTVTKHLQELERLKRTGMKSTGADGTDWIGLAGTVVNPASARTAAALPQASSMLGKVGQGSAVGATFGATAPVTDGGDYWSTKASQVGTGTVLGGAIPAVGTGLHKVYTAVRDALTASPGHMAVKAAGDKVQAVIDALRNQRSDVPGVNLTAGQASVPANSAEFAALQKMVSQRDPSAYAGPAGVQGQQEGARQAAVQTIGRTPRELEAAVEARSAAASGNYGKAFDQVIKGDANLMAMAKNPYFQDALKDATKLAAAREITPKDNLTEFLHLVKVSLDKQLQKSGDTALGATEKQTVLELEKRLVEWLGKKNPDYDAARRTHIDLSKPINQMKLGQEVERALVAPVSAAERPAVFGNAVRKAENTVSKATGSPRIEDLTPAQRQVLAAVEADLQRNAQFKNLAKEGMQSAQERIGAVELPPTGMFAPVISAARSWFNRATGAGAENTLKSLSPLMRDPQKLAEVMQAASPQQRAVMEALLQRYAVGAAGAASATQGDR